MIGTFYRPGRSFLHGYDPRCKLAVLLLFLLLFLLPIPLPLYAGYFTFLALMILTALSARELLRPLRVIGPLLLLVAVLTPPFHREGQVYLRLAGWPLLTSGGVMETARLLVRFAGITLALFGFLRTTSPEQVLLTMRWFGLPFGAGLALSIALQYMPTLRDLYLQVVDAHKLRRSTQEAGSPPPWGLRRLRADLLPVLTSVLIMAVRRITVLAMALEVRGVGLRVRRSSYSALPAGRALLRDALIGAGVLALALAAAFLFT
jgi:energy-coupling factor transporter transmembrane protein EcfT